MEPKALEDRVAIITGSSRGIGIGRALALRLAKEGADIVVTGKSEQSTEKLPGNIYTVAEEIEALGRRALPVRVDVRSEEDVENMVEKTIKTFGRLDILVNNASALWWQPLLETPPKRYDLMWQVNVRGTYLCTYYALPHMVGKGWGHVVTFGPPINTGPNPGQIAYMTTKMGMTRVALGVAAEHEKDNVASNALWPATPIESYAKINWGSEKMGEREQWRSTDILCDATMEILTTEPKGLTGRQLIDEEFLSERGWTQERLDSYWLGEGPPDNPMWIDSRAGANM